MKLNKQIILNSLNKSISNGKKGNLVDNKDIYLYYMLSDFDQFTQGKQIYIKENKIIKRLLEELKKDKSNNICQTSAILSTGPIIKNPDGNGGDPGGPGGGNGGNGNNIDTNPTLVSFSVGTKKQEIIPGSGVLYDSYTFNANDILSNYTDTIDNDFYQLSINRSNLSGGTLKLKTGTNPNQYNLYTQSNSYLTITKDQINNLTYYTNSSSIFEHDLTIKVIDLYQGNYNVSNQVTLTIDRNMEGSTGGNQPPTVGDITLYVNNRSITIITIDMLTTSLTPPYNDPEGDLIDAIRIDEISTANQGKYYYNGLELNEGDIITKEDIEADLFIHEGADINTISSDVLEFSARDKGSKIWVN